MSDCPSPCLPYHLVYTLLTRLWWPSPLVRVGGGPSHGRPWTTNINISGYLSYNHLFIASRSNPPHCGRVGGKTTKLWGHLITTYTKVYRNSRHRYSNNNSPCDNGIMVSFVTQPFCANFSMICSLWKVHYVWFCLDDHLFYESRILHSGTVPLFCKTCNSCVTGTGIFKVAFWEKLMNFV